jgi:hypothetical protein
MGLRTISVSVMLITDMETGEDFLLPSDRDLREMEQRIEQDEEFAERLRGGDKEEQERGLAQKAFCKRRRFDLENLRKSRDRMLPYAERRDYTLVKPGYGKYFEAEGAASGPDENGNAVLSQSKLMHYLLPESILGLSRAEAEALEPVLMVDLWSRLYRAIFPDLNRLPFSRLPSETGCGIVSATPPA